MAADARNRHIAVVLGFGISTNEHVKVIAGPELQGLLDGFVVGSAVVREIQKGSYREKLETTADRVEALCRQLTMGRRMDVTHQKAVEVEAEPSQDSASPPFSASNQPSSTSQMAVFNDCSTWQFGAYGGRYIPETLMFAHEELHACFQSALQDQTFMQRLDDFRRHFINGPTPIHFAKRLSEHCGVKGTQIWFKREELAHTGSHKLNNALGQVLLAQRMGKTRVIAETGAGQHGVATATACAALGLDCVIYMGAVDIKRQRLNVSRIRMLGAQVVPVKSGSQTLKDAVNEALKDWVTTVNTTHFVIGSAIGSHPFPEIVREFQSVIGRESRQQMLCEGEFSKGNGPGRLPDIVVACVGGGSNAIGMFNGFLDDKDVKLVGVEAGGREGPRTNGSNGYHAASISAGTPGVLHGTYTYLLQTESGQVSETKSISAGLDYPAVGPEHAFLNDTKRATYSWVTDDDALNALLLCSKLEGIIPALEPSHALAFAIELAKQTPEERLILVNLCGRGDKDMETVVNARKYLDEDANNADEDSN